MGWSIGVEGRQGSQDILRAQGVHFAERVSGSFRALGSQSEQFEVSGFVQAPERIPPDRGGGGRGGSFDWSVTMTSCGIFFHPGMKTGKR